MGEEFVKGSVGGESEADGRAREIVFLEFEEISAEVIGGEVAPGGEFVFEPFEKESESEGVVFESAWGGVFLGGHEFEEGLDFVIGGVFHDFIVREERISGNLKKMSELLGKFELLGS